MALLFDGDSTYHHVQIVRDHDHVTVLLDGAPSSAINMGDPRVLDFAYMQIMDQMIDMVIPQPTPVKALHLGGCAGSLARSWALTRPGSSNTTVDNDALLINIVRTLLPSVKNMGIKMRHQDVSQAISQLRPGRWDVIVRDVFTTDNDAYGYVPSAATTLQAYHKMTDSAPTVLVNVGVSPYHVDSNGVVLGKRDVAAACEVAKHIIGVRQRAVAAKNKEHNLVVALTRQPIDADALMQRLNRLGLAVEVVGRRRLTQWLGGATPVR